MNTVATSLNYFLFAFLFKQVDKSYSFSMLGVERGIDESLKHDKSANNVQDERKTKEKVAIVDESLKNLMYSAFRKTCFLPLYEVK